MKITRQTKLSEARYFLTEEHMKKIIAGIKDEDLPGRKKNLFKEPISTFIELNSGKKEAYDKYFEINEETTVFNYACQIKRLQKDLEGILKREKQNQISQDEKQKQAAIGIKFVSYNQSVLIFCMENFGLKSLKEAESVITGEYLILKTHKSAQEKYIYNYRRILEPKK